MQSSWISTHRRRVKVEKIAGWYDVWTGDLPFAKFTLKVVESVDGGYAAHPNVFVKSSDGIEYTLGVGGTVADAVTDAIECFYNEIEKVAPIDQIEDGAFVWLNWTPFGATSS